MLRNLNQSLKKSSIKKALERAAPKIIPLSGIKRLRQRDYFTVWLNEHGTDGKFFVSGWKQGGPIGLYFFTTKGYRATVKEQLLDAFSIEITHYFGELEFTYRSPFSFYWALLTFQARRRVWRFRFRVWLFGKKRLPRKERMEVLTWAYHRTIDSDVHAPSFIPLGFLIDKHSELIVFHPEKERLIRYYRIVFDSLEASGDFVRQKTSSSFSLSSRALSTLDKYEEADRRHTDNIRQQKILGVLTAGLVLIGMGQLVTALAGGG